MDNCHSIVDKPVHNPWKTQKPFPTSYTHPYPQFHTRSSYPQTPHFLRLLQYLYANQLKVDCMASGIDRTPKIQEIIIPTTNRIAPAFITNGISINDQAGLTSLFAPRINSIVAPKYVHIVPNKSPKSIILIMIPPCSSVKINS